LACPGGVDEVLTTELIIQKKRKKREKDREKRKKIRIKKAPSIDRAHRGFQLLNRLLM